MSWCASLRFIGLKIVDINYSALLPEILLTVTGIVILVLIPFFSKRNQNRLPGMLALAGILVAMIAVFAQWGTSGTGFFDMVFQDRFGQICKLIFLFSSGAVLITSMPYLETEEIRVGEYYSLLLFATVGMCLMVASSDLIMTFIGLEILSIGTYILAGFRIDEVRSTESALKYFILGAFSTSFLLYGIALVYGETATTKYLPIAGAIEQSSALSPLLVLGLGLMVVGFGFKMSMVPFHVWAPDVYEGAPVPISAHLAVGSKAAAVLALLRILYQALPRLGNEWQAILWAAAVLTMLVGNIAALSQNNIKRMLAYSSIGHAGYLLVGMTSKNSTGAQAILYYLVAYAFMTLGAFIIVQLVGGRHEERIQISDFQGLSRSQPFLSACLAIFLISLAGIPTTAGFMGKFFLFSAAIEDHFYWLVVLGVIASAIGIYYYLRVIVAMYMRDPEGEPTGVSTPLLTRAIIVIMVAGTFYLGLFPAQFLQITSEAIRF